MIVAVIPTPCAAGSRNLNLKAQRLLHRGRKHDKYSSLGLLLILLYHSTLRYPQDPILAVEALTIELPTTGPSRGHGGEPNECGRADVRNCGDLLWAGSWAIDMGP